jgi:hypothetical protein
MVYVSMGQLDHFNKMISLSMKVVSCGQITILNRFKLLHCRLKRRKRKYCASIKWLLSQHFQSEIVEIADVSKRSKTLGEGRV